MAYDNYKAERIQDKPERIIYLFVAEGLAPNNPVLGAVEAGVRPPNEANGDLVANSEAGLASGLTSNFGGAVMGIDRSSLIKIV